jgi:FAD/FMN-containing dehydrogenase/Fe-S oxidoreductase
MKTIILNNRKTDTGTQEENAGIGAELRSKVKGEIRFDRGSRALYATDGSNYRQVPIGVVVPRTAEDVVATVAAAKLYGLPVLGRGGGTSLAGQCCNEAVVLDFSKYMNQILALDPDKKQAQVQPGLVLDDLRDAAEKHHLTFGPDPSTHNHCTLGGMIGNNSCGVHSVMAGMTSDNIEELEILTYDGLRMRVGPTSEEELARIIQEGGRRGEIYSRLKELRDKYADLIRQKFPDIPRRVSGYNLPALLPENGFNVARALVGSESTLVTVLEATVRLVHSPPQRSLLVLGYPDIYAAADHVPEILPHKPIGLEGLDDLLVDDMKKKGLHPKNIELLPPGKGWLLVEFGGQTKQEADDMAHKLMDELKQKDQPPHMKLLDDPWQERQIWVVRRSGLGATARVPGEPDAWEGWEDSSVPPAKLGAYLRDLRQLFNKYEYEGAFYGHFGQGCVHTRISFDLKTGPGIRDFRSFLHEAAHLVVSYGGSLSGEHGDGQSRGELLPIMFGDELMQAFREFKTIWDPNWKMNPGKIVEPYRVDENLRYGTSYDPPQLETYFKYPDDRGSFSYAMERCVGVGECRKHDSGIMCPSYMATREEADSTRGRARLLWEMLKGNPLKEGWRSQPVREALDLCLACKGCKGECPMHVDMATYKAEFLAHYYKGRIRPLAAYSMGLIYWWAGLAARLPWLVNFVAHAPLLNRVVKALGGIAQQREVPKFASRTFKDWFEARPVDNSDKPEVILWADTFNNHFHPEIAQAAVEVLEAAGYRVAVPEKALCCGRPLFDWGMLDLNRYLLRQILETLKPQIEAGKPVVGLEPSCVSVFRDELGNLFPNDEDARRLGQQVFTLSEFLLKEVPNYQPPTLKRKVLVQGHCHHQSVMKMDCEQKLMQKMGLDFEILNAGCCGMAGAFGFEKDHYDVSIKVGERVLLPTVRQADPDTLIVADGFSCHEQIAQTTGRRPLHLAQVLQMALHNNEPQISQATPSKDKALEGHASDIHLASTV